MLIFITSAALLYWAAWLYYQHVIKPVNDEQTTNYNEDAKAITSMGDCSPVCKTTVIDECPHCNGSGYIYLN